MLTDYDLQKLEARDDYYDRIHGRAECCDLCEAAPECGQHLHSVPAQEFGTRTWLLICVKCVEKYGIELEE